MQHIVTAHCICLRTTSVVTVCALAARIIAGTLCLVVRAYQHGLRGLNDSITAKAREPFHHRDSGVALLACVGLRALVSVRTAMDVIVAANSLRFRTASITRYAVFKLATGVAVWALTGLVWTYQSRGQSAILEGSIIKSKRCATKQNGCLHKDL